MKTAKITIWWVDDEPSRLRDLAIRRIETSPLKGQGRRMAKVEPILLKTQADRVSFENKLIKAMDRQALPELVVLDQNLNQVAAEGLRLRGSSLAVSIRAEAASVPIVGVTAGQIGRIPELQREQFIELFALDDLQSGSRIPDLYAIINGFATLVREYPPSGKAGGRSERVLNWFGCPPEDLELLSSCLPGDFIGQWDDETAHVFARWVWHTLMGRAGFLCDDLELATLLGASEKGLQRLLRWLTGCEYVGVFASTTRRRWWVSRVRTAIRQRTGAPVTEPLWKLGRQLLGSNNAAVLSSCHGRRQADCVPDVVAFEDETLRERIQAKSEDTKFIETDSPPVGFEKRRVFSRK